MQVSDFDPDIEDARGVHRLQTAEEHQEGRGTADLMPFDSYWTAFTIGSLVYTVELHGPPGSVSAEQAQEIASAYHDRLTGD